MEYTHILLNDLKMAIKKLQLLYVNPFEFPKRLPDNVSLFTTELEAVVSTFCYIKITTKNNRFVAFDDCTAGPVVQV